ncbi:unnamed protein product [Protopolystoma xenopodis]|uniref:CS domain-containing protein n=1 Tax=Protopolystoma xenopodis TaxID=117903 RepID=A0A3S5CUZ0_9PLAT|nr:unnamed protein product [Protopolystoma xenopodis]
MSQSNNLVFIGRPVSVLYPWPKIPKRAFIFPVLFCSLTPTVLWAQRADLVYLTICLGDIKNKVLDLTNDGLSFKLAFTLSNFFQRQSSFYLSSQSSRQMSTDRQIVMVLKKCTPTFWPRLLKSSEKALWLKTDFERWVDEDEADYDAGGGNMDFSNMMSQMSSFGGTNEYDDLDADVDSDDDDLPDLDMPAGDTCVSTCAEKPHHPETPEKAKETPDPPETKANGEH